MTNEEAIKYLIPPTATSTKLSTQYLKQKKAYDLAIKALEEQRPKGEWIKGREISRTMIGDYTQDIEYKNYTCSNCGLVLDNLLYHYDGSPFYKFCPNCGADMR